MGTVSRIILAFFAIATAVYSQAPQFVVQEGQLTIKSERHFEEADCRGLSVRVVGALDALGGSCAARDGVLVFTPKAPFDPGVSYVATLRLDGGVQGQVFKAPRE